MNLPARNTISIMIVSIIFIVHLIMFHCNKPRTPDTAYCPYTFILQKYRMELKKMRNYRGFTKDGKEVHGWYMEHPFRNAPTIFKSVIVQDERPFEVLPETVGQSTGRKDKNGREIYEGDLYETSYGEAVIRWNEIMCRFELYISEGQYWSLDVFNIHYYPFIGTIHDRDER